MSLHKKEASSEAHSALDKQLKAAANDAEQHYAARTNAKEVIYAAASKWVGKELNTGDGIPTLRNGEETGTLSDTLLGGVKEVEAILNASVDLNAKELQEQITHLTDLQKKAEAFRDALAITDLGSLAKANYAARRSHSNLEGRVLNALGFSKAAYISADALSKGLISPLAEKTLELEKLQPAKGRPENRKAISVAQKAGIFYTTVTGKQPTNGDGRNGLSGEFTPFLRDLYDAFGWKSRSLTAGIKAAMEAAKAVNLAPAKNAPPGLLSTDPSKWPYSD